MARRAPAVETVDADCIDDAFHPRRTLRLSGHAEALGIAARAIRSGRPPQGWMLCGPPGIGKATFGYRIARYLLAFGATDRGPADLSVPANDQATALIAAGAHPGLLTLKRRTNPDTGKLMGVLAVEEVRKLAGFFGMTSGMGGWRIALIDAVDDMNEAAANALLKLLEEPPTRAMLLLVAHAPGRTLPTIRSRCQKLIFRPLDDAAMAAEMKLLMPDTAPDERDGLIRLSGGSPGAALRLASGDGVILAGEADRLIESAGDIDIPALFALADKIARIADGLDMFGEFLLQSLNRRIRMRAPRDGARLKPWSDAFDRIAADGVRAGTLHLDPRQTLLQMARAAGRAAKTAGSV
jgi:DNA polymerase III subunit delta'